MEKRIETDGWLLISKARHLMIEARKKELAPYGISPRLAHVAQGLYNLGGKATLAELAKHSERGRSTLSLQLTKMEKDGLVKKIRENPKSALKRFELTEKGVIAYKNAEEKRSVKRIMSVISDEELQQLTLILNKLIWEAEK